MAALALLSGCASQLVVSGLPDDAQGIPVARSMTVIEQFELLEHSELAICTPSVNEQFAAIPSGETYYVNAEAAQFGSSEFSINLNPDGTLNTLSLNSVPAPSEAAQALASVAGAAAPIISPGGRDTLPVRDIPARCNTGKRIICLKSLDGEPIRGTCR